LTGELAKRWGVASVGIPAVLALTYMGGWYLAVPLAGFAAWGAHEVFRFSARKGVRAVEPIGITGSAALVLLAAWRPSFVELAPWALGVLAMGSLLAMLAALRGRGPDDEPLSAVAVTLFGMVYVGLALAFIPLVHALPAARGWSGAAGAASGMGALGGAVGGLVVVALPLATTWIGDAAAFFAGSAWGAGRRRLAPRISPNKTWVGFWAALSGAAVAAFSWALVARAVLPGANHDLALLVVAGAALGLAAVVGDLAESLLKRGAGVKDSGTFFPGHGGVLDRIDSLIFTFPTAYVALVLLDVAR